MRIRALALCTALLTARAYAHDPVLTAPSVLEAPAAVRPATLAGDGELRVVLLLQLDREGHVVDAAPAHTTDPAALEAARSYVRGVRFAPAMRGDQPVPATIRFEVSFPSPSSVPSSQPGPDEAHVHTHVHVTEHSHAHAKGEAHEHAPEYGASAHLARPERSASSYRLERRDLPRGAHVLAGDLVRAVPGMFVVQHAGGGKANQYFLRGFDADHGTDVALSVDGVPVNMVSHGHGQGYADLNWIIPELIDSVQVRKGPYDPRDGDFATAGAIDFQTARDTPSRLTLEAGMFHSYRALGIVNTRWSKLQFTGAAEVSGSDGPFERSEDLERVNLFARASADLGDGELSLTLSGYASGWNASGQIPLREVRAGRLDRFGFVDPHEGGQSSRHNLSLRYRSAPDAPQRWDVLAYASLYSFALYSNFTFFRDDPERGDMIHQRDQRALQGVQARYERDDSFGPFENTARAGFDLRHDEIDNGLDRAPAREWAAALVDAHIDQTSAGAYLEDEVRWLRWLRTTVGVRGDLFGFAVRDRLEDRETLGSRSSGERLASRVSPKASATLSPLSWLSLYANYGLGFHSNDARGVVRGVTPLTRADGYEVGVSVKLLERIKLRCALFRIDLESELVWVGDEGTTEASGATRRQGVEADLHVDVQPWLWADVALTLSQAKFRDAAKGEEQVPLAPRRMLTGKLTAIHPKGPFARFTLLYLGDRPATEDGAITAAGFTRADLSLGYHHPRFEVAVALENLLNTAWRESQFATTSRLPGESTCQNGSRAVSEAGSLVGCEDLHFTPGTPFAFRASASVSF